MKSRTSPKIWFKEEIFNKYSKPKQERRAIGRINFVSYLCGDKTIPHLEFYLEEEFRGKGIMSIELPKYLKKRKKYRAEKVLAVVEENNIASIKLLEANEFIQISKIRDKIIYFTDLTLTKNELIKNSELV
jgi:RimJ/RimL family protein N-acetyltransferase